MKLNANPTEKMLKVKSLLKKEDSRNYDEDRKQQQIKNNVMQWQNIMQKHQKMNLEQCVKNIEQMNIKKN